MTPPEKSATENRTAFPRLILEEDRPTTEPPLSRAFHERNLSHLIGLRAGEGIWPADPEDAEAVALFTEGQQALYHEKDMVKAIRALEAALDREPAYLKAWVSLSIAYISDNTPGSLEQAEAVLEQLAALEPGDWLSGEASSIIHQNLAYLHVHHYRQGGKAAHLRRADEEYGRADALCAGNERIEYLCPWSYVKSESGERDAARALWARARNYAAANRAGHLLQEYAAKYAPLRAFLASSAQN